MLKNPLIRSKVSVTNSLERDNIRVMVAEEKHDFEMAFRLLHDSYFESGLMDKHISGLRCNSYSFLPHTTVIVLKKDDTVIGTVTLIRDSAMGLPSDEKYKAENDSLRENGRVLTEVSALAIDKKFRNQGHILTLFLTKYMYIYSKNHSDTEYLVCTVHPRAEDYHRALWGFERKGKIVSYDYVKGALAVYMNMPISAEHESASIKKYNSSDPTKNLLLYCLQDDQRFVYPNYQKGQILNMRMTPELLNYFFNIRTDLFSQLNDLHKKMFYEIYYYHFNKEHIDKYFPRTVQQVVREFRTPTKLRARIIHNENIIEAVILDLNSSGCYVSLFSQAGVKHDDEVVVNFSLGDQEFVIKGNSRWKNNGTTNRFPTGMGVKFNVSVINLSKELKKWIKHNEEDQKRAA